MMGLDMFLVRRNKNIKENSWDSGNKVMEWRKAWHIREWFLGNLGREVENHENAYYVTKKNLEDLIADCKAVLVDSKKAPRLLPIPSDFCSAEYDEWYFQILQDTVKGLEKVIEETDWEKQEVAYSEWW